MKQLQKWLRDLNPRPLDPQKGELEVIGAQSVYAVCVLRA